MLFHDEGKLGHGRQQQIIEEHAELERLFLAETGADIYEPYFPYQQKLMSKSFASSADTTEIFEARTDNDHMSIRDARLARYVKERQ